MISLAPLWAIALRHIRMLRRDPNALLFGLYWPALDIITWGFLGAWIQRSQPTQFHNYETIALLGILLWQIIGRGCNIIIITLSEELWSNNIVNLFSLPLRTLEWICGAILYMICMMIITIITSMLIIYALYNVELWPMITTFLMFMPPLLISSIWVGFTCLQVVVLLGKRGLELGFALSWFLLPFSGAYYPIEVLPQWGQWISAFLPMSYVFQGMRNYLMYQQDPTPFLMKGYALSIPYALVALIMFIRCFNYSKQNGLSRLTD